MLMEDKVTSNFTHAKALYDAGKIRESILELRRVLQAEPEHRDAHRLLAHALYRQKSFDAAASELEALLRYDENNAWVNSSMGAVQAGKKNWKRAASYYRKAIDINPTYVNAYIGLGMALAKVATQTKQRAYWNEAEQAFQTALSLQPHKQSAKSLAGLANVQWHLGHKEVALTTVRRATETNARYMYGWTYLIRFQVKSGKVREAWGTWKRLWQTGFHFENETAA